LVLKNELDEYRLELADFGKVYINGGKVSGNSGVHATPQYDSPEIAALNKKPSASDHKHYYDEDKGSRINNSCNFSKSCYHTCYEKHGRYKNFQEKI
jgi:hypothetical protein